MLGIIANVVMIATRMEPTAPRKLAAENRRAESERPAIRADGTAAE